MPEPLRQRWQPLRLGLVELFHYDSEEFWFRDGHLLLRGNNGTGKSKVLSLTLPFLFDAQLRSSRVEPDGDSGKKMAWNLLMNSYPRRIGYAWIEFGRIAADGTPRYLTLGAGLSAWRHARKWKAGFSCWSSPRAPAARPDRASAATSGPPRDAKSMQVEGLDQASKCIGAGEAALVDPVQLIMRLRDALTS